MNRTLTTALSAGAPLAISASSAMAAGYGLSTGDPSNGLTNIYSSTIDGGSLGNNRGPCTGSSPPYCAFFGLDLLTGVAVSFAPNPSGVTTNVPGGIGPAFSPNTTPTPGNGSFLDITLSGGNTSATLNGGVVTFGTVLLNILFGNTTVTATDAGFVLLPGQAGMAGVAVDGNGIAEFLVGLAGNTGPVVGDFSSFSAVTSGCAGSLCGLIPALSLDMKAYRLLVDFDPTFTTFTASLIGQTGNNSLLYATLNTPVPGAVWLFGSALGMLGLARRRSA
jgi:hypothetical protein